MLAVALLLWVWGQRGWGCVRGSRGLFLRGGEGLTALRWAMPKELLPCKPAAATGGRGAAGFWVQRTPARVPPGDSLFLPGDQQLILPMVWELLFGKDA